jgi:hypothetical protein
MPVEILRRRMLHSPICFDSLDLLAAPTAPSASLVSTTFAELSVETWKGNCALARHRYKFDADFSVFLWNLLQLKPALPEQAFDDDAQLAPSQLYLAPAATAAFRSPVNSFTALKLAARFFLDTHLRSNAVLCTNPVIAQKSGSSPAPVAGRTTSGWISYLQGLLQHPSTRFATEASEWLLTTLIDARYHDRWLFGMLFVCPEPANRQAFSDVILSACKQLAPFHRQFYSSPVLEPQNPSVLVRFMDKLILMILRASHHWRYFHHFFAFLLAFARIGPVECNFLLGRHLVSELVCFARDMDSPFLSKHVKNVVS